MMMILGMFPFSIPTATYQQLQRSTNWRHPSNSRVGDMPAYQFIGRGEDTISLDGSIVPEFGAPMSISALRVMGDTGKPFPLISGTGKVYGLYIINDVQETQTFFYKNGKARKVEFNLKITQTQKPGVLIGNTVGSLLGF
ncbi:phage tail protein [Acinetobacter sp. MD2(2019)]|uniref:phage tail protein n=1 Tax=Acinetobacter sp. MD2(2019) TaxID=2605273 RepID=UPI002D1F0C31|nr:phage tail protein [Acinetobacter sp. MD2(2019)]MEB3754703.1 phage tail protein [Acinetobacter sp. MD2(2019)]